MGASVGWSGMNMDLSAITRICAPGNWAKRMVHKLKGIEEAKILGTNRCLGRVIEMDGVAGMALAGVPLQLALSVREPQAMRAGI